MPSKLHLAHRRLLILSCVLAGAPALAACPGPLPPLLLTVPVAASLREACPHPDPEGVETQGDLAAYSDRQDAAITGCDARRQALVEAIDAHNAKVAKP